MTDWTQYAAISHARTHLRIDRLNAVARYIADCATSGRPQHPDAHAAYLDLKEAIVKEHRRYRMLATAPLV